MTSPCEPRCAELREALRHAASPLKEHGPGFALAGSYALWAYGAPEPTHDVLPPTTVFIQKLRALTEHYCDFAKLIPAARAVREQLDWERIADETAENDFAAAFLVLYERLGLRT